MFADLVDLAVAGCRYHQDLNGDGQVSSTELGLVLPSTSPMVDFRIDRDPSTLELIIVSQRAGAGVALYAGAGPAARPASLFWWRASPLRPASA